MNIKYWVIGLCLGPCVTFTDLSVADVESHSNVEGISTISTISKLNTLFKELNLSKSVKGSVKEKGLDNARRWKSKFLSNTLKVVYQLGGLHEFLPLNEKGNYGHYYSFQHYIDGLPVDKEIVTVVLDDNNRVTKMFGGDNISSASMVQSMSSGTKETSESVSTWLKTNPNSPFFSVPYLSVNSIKRILYKHKELGLLTAFEIDLFLIDNEDKPNRLQLFVDPISKEFFEKNDILEFNGNGKFEALGERVSSSKRINAWGGNFRTGKRVYAKDTPYAPMVSADCSFDKFDVTTYGVNKKHVITVDMKNSTVLNNWSPYSLSATDCQNTKDFYEPGQFSSTLAFSPLADAHLHAEIVVEMYKELLNETILGACTGNSSQHENCKEYYSMFGGASNDVPIYQGVHYGINYRAAFWSGRAAYYGDGGFGVLPNVSLDVVAHELTHGYNDIISSDIYLGALEESISDMAGEAAKEYMFNRNASYFVGSGYDVNYKNLFGREILETASALRELLHPPMTMIPKEAVGISKYDLSGPISLAFSRLVNDKTLLSFGEAFKILANAKKVCANSSLTGYKGIQVIADCLIDHANQLVNRDVEEKLRLALNKVGMDLKCKFGSFCDVLKKGIQTRREGNLYVFFLAQNNLNLTMKWTISDGLKTYTSTANEITITQIEMDGLANDYKVSSIIKMNHGGENSIEKAFQKNKIYCVPPVTKSNSYIGLMKVGSHDFVSNNEGYRFDSSIPLSIVSGDTLSISIEVKGTASVAKKYNLDLWIDANANFKFDKNEKNLSTLISNDGKLHNYNVSPGLLVSGNVIRMRAIFSENNIPGPCENGVIGEIEDVVLVVQ